MRPDHIGEFCRRLVEGASPAGRLQPAEVAREFVGYFGLSTFPKMEEIIALLRRAGIETAPCTNLPHGLRGVHVGIKNGPYFIEYDAFDWDGAQEHTVLHETYEIVMGRIRDMHPGSDFPSEKWLCKEADRFAASTLMQPDCFSLFAEATGFDVLSLRSAYGRAYSTLTLRLAEVMRHQPLLAVLYERKGDNQGSEQPEEALDDAGLTATVVARTPGFRLRTDRRPLSRLRGLLPRRGSPPAPGSVVETVVRSGRPVYVDRVSGYDLWRCDDVTVAARPVLWGGQVSKVALVAVPYRDRSVLRPQLEQDVFHHIEEAHQVI